MSVVLPRLLGVLFLSCAWWYGFTTDGQLRLGGTSVEDPLLLTVYVLSVGQGDAIHLRTPGGVDVLIDTGRDARVLEELGRTLPLSDRVVEHLVLTHPDADHIGGVPFVFEHYEVDAVYSTSDRGSSGLADLVWMLAHEQAGSSSLLMRGDSIQLSKDVEVVVLWPQMGDAHSGNDDSIVLRAVAGRSHLLFTGDIERPTEDALLGLQDEARYSLQSDVLKVAHHGSVSSSSSSFLQAVLPTYSVISAGLENAYGHPHDRTVSELHRYSSSVLRTDLDGSIRCVVHESGVMCEPV
ncbi:MAG: MBL fold metallo-hydrolase [Candidatus Andersenbacteria bacterium]|nr:MBL fold metallo-hydrolase [Candidatus Andersenbacteria bacterium]